MKQLLLLGSFLLLYLSGYTQTISYIRHKYYDVAFSMENNSPSWVFYKLDWQNIDCNHAIGRDFNFSADPNKPGSNFAAAYRNSGYDRGHMMSAANNICDSIGMIESFYYTNICPQTPELNRVLWKNVENKERDMVRAGYELTVLCGGLDVKEAIGVKKKVTVPNFCWKIIISRNMQSGQMDTSCYVFPNVSVLLPDFEDYSFLYLRLEEFLRFTVKDMITLHELGDSVEAIKYLVNGIHKKIDELKSLRLDSVIQYCDSIYQGNSSFRDEFRESGYSVPDTMSLHTLITNIFNQSRASLATVSQSILEDLTNQSTRLGETLYTVGRVADYFKSANLCSRCGMPRDIPICVAKRLPL